MAAAEADTTDEPTDEPTNGRPEPLRGANRARTGSAQILEKADPSVSVERVASWVERARREGLVQ